jgi:hypothetical protein
MKAFLDAVCDNMMMDWWIPNKESIKF